MPDAVAAAPAERALPHNLEAERSVLGAVLIHNDAFNFAVEIVAPTTSSAMRIAESSRR